MLDGRGEHRDRWLIRFPSVSAENRARCVQARKKTLGNARLSVGISKVVCLASSWYTSAPWSSAGSFADGFILPAGR